MNKNKLNAFIITNIINYCHKNVNLLSPNNCNSQTKYLEIIIHFSSSLCIIMTALMLLLYLYKKPFENQIQVGQ